MSVNVDHFVLFKIKWKECNKNSGRLYPDSKDLQTVRIWKKNLRLPLYHYFLFLLCIFLAFVFVVKMWCFAWPREVEGKESLRLCTLLSEALQNYFFCFGCLVWGFFDRHCRSCSVTFFHSLTFLWKLMWDNFLKFTAPRL